MIPAKNAHEKGRSEMTLRPSNLAENQSA